MHEGSGKSQDMTAGQHTCCLLLLSDLCADLSCGLVRSCSETSVIPQALTALTAAQLCVSEAAGNIQCDSQLFLRQQQQLLLQPFQGFAAHYAKGKGKSN